MNWWQRRSAWEQSALIGIAVTGGLSSSYVGMVNTCCCFGVLLGALVAVYYYSEHTTGAVPAGDGAMLGMVSGVGGALLAAFIEMGMRVVGVGVRGALERVVRMAPGAFHDLKPMVHGHEAWGVLWMIVEMGAEMIVFGVVGAVGGAVGTALFDGGPAVSGSQEASGGGESNRDGSD
jgi:hypothetical protein